jgi:hypothetical protein
LHLFQNISYLDFGEGEMGEAWASCCGECRAVGVARWKALPGVEKCLLKFSIIVDLSVVTVFPSLSGIWNPLSKVGQDGVMSEMLLYFMFNKFLRSCALGT